MSNIAQLCSKFIRFKRDEESFIYPVFRKRIGPIPIYLDPETGPQSLWTLLLCFVLGLLLSDFQCT